MDVESQSRSITTSLTMTRRTYSSQLEAVNRAFGLSKTGSLRSGSRTDPSGPLSRDSSNGASVVQDRHVELAKALGVGDQVYFDDLPAPDRDAEHDGRPSALSPHEPRGPVHQRGLGGPGTPREGLRHSRSTEDFPRCAHLFGCSVGSEH